MLWLTYHLAQLLVTLALCALGLWCAVALESYRVLRQVHAVRELRRRCWRLLAALRHARTERDRWRAEAVRWQRAYWTAVDHEGEDAHPTARQPAVLTLVRASKEDDAPVP